MMHSDDVMYTFSVPVIGLHMQTYKQQQQKNVPHHKYSYANLHNLEVEFRNDSPEMWEGQLNNESSQRAVHAKHVLRVFRFWETCRCSEHNNLSRYTNFSLSGRKLCVLQENLWNFRTIFLISRLSGRILMCSARKFCFLAKL